jgi:hypothetical protein
VFHNFFRFWFFCLGKQWANFIRRTSTVKPVFTKTLAPPVPRLVYAKNRVNHAPRRGFRAAFSRVLRELHAGAFLRFDGEALC